jgi:hypothetical protein
MRHWLRKLFASQGRHKSARRPRSVRPGLEQLDERAVPSVTPLGDITGFPYGMQLPSNDRTVARSSATGNFAVTWHASNDDSNSSDGIYVRLFRADGTALTGPIHVGKTTSTKDLSSSIAMNASGQFVVAWTHHYSANDTDIHVQRFNADGSLSGFEAVAAGSSHNESEPSVALDNYGNLMVAYTYDYSSADQDVYVWAQRASGASNTFALATSTHNEHAPSLALNGAGLGVVAYEYDYSSTDHDIYAQRVWAGGFWGNDGHSYGSLIPVDTGGANQTDPSAAIDANGELVVSYTVASGSLCQVYVRHFDASNNPSGLIPVGDSLHAELCSSVAIDNYGRFIVAYMRTTFKIGDEEVLAEVFNSDNSVRDGPFVVATGGDDCDPTVALGIDDLTSNSSGSGWNRGQAVFAFLDGSLSSRPSGLPGMSAALADNL